MKSINIVKYCVAIYMMACITGKPGSIAMDLKPMPRELEFDKSYVSVNWRERDDVNPQILTLHCIGLSSAWIFENYGCLQDKGKGLGVSAHYYIPQEGKIYQMVPEEKTAYHAGESEWRSFAKKNKLLGLNNLSIGIEFQSLGFGQIDEKVYYPYSFASFSEEQINSGIALCRQIMKTHNISPENVVWHSDVSPLRMNNVPKTDPGPIFNGRRFAENGVGVWPSSKCLQDTELDVSLPYIQLSLKKWGYPYIEETDCFDEATKYVLGAFYMHYLPEEVNWKTYELQQTGSIFDHITEWRDFSYDKKKLVIALENLNNRNFEFPIL